MEVITDLKQIFHKELDLLPESSLVSNPDIVVAFVRDHLSGILAAVGEDPSALSLILLRGSLARRNCGPYSDIDIEAFAESDTTVVDTYVRIEGYFVSYYRSSLLDMTMEIASSSVSMWHIGGISDSLVLYDGGGFSELLLATVRENSVRIGKTALARGRIPMRRLLEYRRKVYNTAPGSTIFLRYAAYHATYNFVLTWYALNYKPIVSESTLFDYVLCRLPLGVAGAIRQCIELEVDKERMTAAVDQMVGYISQILPEEEC